MSCLIVSHETLSIVANFIARLLYVGYDSFGFAAPEEVFTAFKDCTDKRGVYREKQIYCALRDLNLKAYYGRYKDEVRTEYEEQECINPDVDIWKAPVVKDNSYMAQDWHYRMLKSLQFLEYQLSEDTTRSDAKVESLSELIRVLALFIATHNDKYNSVNWG